MLIENNYELYPLFVKLGRLPGSDLVWLPLDVRLSYITEHLKYLIFPDKVAYSKLFCHRRCEAY